MGVDIGNVSRVRVIPLRDKDKFNRSQPKNDVANFGAYILDPEVPKLLAGVLHLSCPPTPAGGRTDILDLRLEHHADVGMRDAQGLTARDLAARMGAQGALGRLATV